jgi:hypothetical protein
VSQYIKAQHWASKPAAAAAAAKDDAKGRVDVVQKEGSRPEEKGCAGQVGCEREKRGEV